jgi:hypothetical protein
MWVIAERYTLATETQDAALAARIEIAAHNVADLDRRLNQVDTAIEEAAKRRQDQHRPVSCGRAAPGSCEPRR